MVGVGYGVLALAVASIRVALVRTPRFPLLYIDHCHPVPDAVGRMTPAFTAQSRNCLCDVICACMPCAQAITPVVVTTCASATYNSTSSDDPTALGCRASSAGLVEVCESPSISTVGGLTVLTSTSADVCGAATDSAICNATTPGHYTCRGA